MKTNLISILVLLICTITTANAATVVHDGTVRGYDGEVRAQTEAPFEIGGDLAEFLGPDTPVTFLIAGNTDPRRLWGETPEWPRGHRDRWQETFITGLRQAANDINVPTPTLAAPCNWLVTYNRYRVSRSGENQWRALMTFRTPVDLDGNEYQTEIDFFFDFPKKADGNERADIERAVVNELLATIEPPSEAQLDMLVPKLADDCRPPHLSTRSWRHQLYRYRGSAASGQVLPYRLRKHLRAATAAGLFRDRCTPEVLNEKRLGFILKVGTMEQMMHHCPHIITEAQARQICHALGWDTRLHCQEWQRELRRQERLRALPKPD